MLRVFVFTWAYTLGRWYPIISPLLGRQPEPVMLEMPLFTLVYNLGQSFSGCPHTQLSLLANQALAFFSFEATFSLTL